MKTKIDNNEGTHMDYKNWTSHHPNLVDILSNQKKYPSKKNEIDNRVQNTVHFSSYYLIDVKPIRPFDRV